MTGLALGHVHRGVFFQYWRIVSDGVIYLAGNAWLTAESLIRIQGVHSS
jgi:hypothetical protein